VTVRELPLWQDPPLVPRAALPGDRDAAVCVIGAGIGGLSTAWHLADHGIAALVVEARTAAGGASGRNGGFLIAGAAPFHNDARRLFGRETAVGIYRATLEAQQQVYALAAQLGAATAFERVGGLRIAMDAAEAEHAREQLAALTEDGLPGELVEAADLPAPFRREERVGVLTAHDATMNPVSWIRALAAAVEERGATLCEQTRVDGPLAERDGAAWVVRTPHGRVRAEHVVVACDAALPQLVPGYAGRVRPRRLHMVATGPLPTRVLDVAAYARYGYEYVQQRPDGRVAAGGFSDLDGEASYTVEEQPNPVVHERLERYLREELGIAARVTHRWVGVVGYSDDQRPYAGAARGADGLYVLGGYSGTGNLNGFVAGRAVAELIAEGRSPDAALYDSGR
jgi:gamma-glutamylputrescine oxidase